MERIKVPVTEEEKKLPYYKFFERDLPPIGEEQAKIIAGGKPAGGPGLPFSEMDRFIANKDDDTCQVGYGHMPDGTGYVCNWLYWPGVTGEMFDWYMAWNPVGGDLRYKIWHPYTHRFQKTSDAARLLNPGIPVRERLWGTRYFIYEGFVGPDEPVSIEFLLHDPSHVVDPSLLNTESCGGVNIVSGQGGFPVVSMEKWYPHKDGILLKSRFWMGVGLDEDEKPYKMLPDGEKFPTELLTMLFQHCVEEYTNLGSFLAELYSDMEGKIE